MPGETLRYMGIFPLQMNQLLLLCLLVATAYAATIDNDSFRPIIEKVNSIKTTWKADPNFPSDVTISSIKRLLGARKSANTLPLKQDNDISVTPIPEEFDARQQWPECPTISQIADQSNCGSCWAVATATTFSDRLCIASKGKFTLPLSAEHLMTCCSYCGNGCFGGYPYLSWLHFKDEGLPTGGTYNSSLGCQPYSLPLCEHGIPGSLPQCSSFPTFDTPQCEEQCTNSQYELPLEQDRHKGVYQKVSDKSIGGHAVRVIGWGTEDGTPYWLVANTWNNHWGDGGFFKILRGKDECGFESQVTAGVPLV